MSAGVSRQHENVIAFTARLRLDMVAPSNGLLTNPEFLEHTVQRAGMNLVRGAHNLVEDRERADLRKRPVGADEFGGWPQSGRDAPARSTEAKRRPFVDSCRAMPAAR